MSKKRENGLDLLRVIAAILVCAVHVCNVGRAQAADYTDLNFEFHFFYVVFHLAQAAVACFIALSGAFILKASSTKDYMAFYRRTWKKIVIPTIIFSVFYIIFLSAVNCIDDPGTNLPATFMKYLAGQTALGLLGYPAVHMWYMFMLMVLYLLAPFVVLAREHMGEKHFAKAAVILWILGVVDTISQDKRLTTSWSIGYCADVLGIFMLGYVMHEWALKRKGRTEAGIGLIAGGCGLFTAEYMIWLLIRGNEQIAEFFQQRPHNPFLSMGALLCIAGFTILEFKVNFGTLSLLTLWVYIVHPAIIDLLRIVEGAILHVPYTEIGKDKPVLTGTINIVIVVILSFIVAWFVEKAMNWNGKVSANKKTGGKA
jgi:surface polysaccharide O-acyltransferase-like enzyme